jgi:putative transposase
MTAYYKKVNSMQLVEQHVIGGNDPSYTVIDEVAFRSKNLYTAARYEMRQASFTDSCYTYHTLRGFWRASHTTYQ